MAEIKKVAIYGGGTIGGGFAAYYALKGLDVAVFEEQEASVNYATGIINNVFQTYINLGMLEDAGEARSRVTITSDPQAVFADAYMIQENGKEDVQVKREIIALIENYAPTEAIIASSSTGITPTLLAKEAAHPERILVAHPFNPSYLLPLIEIAGGEHTEQEYIDRAVEFYKSVDKVPVVMKKEKPGFIANRLSHAVWREELAMVLEGVCTLEDADNALTYGPGLRWAAFGPGLNYELASGTGGIREVIEKFSATSNVIFKDLSTMPEMPAQSGAVCEEQMKDLIGDLPEHIGKEKSEIAAYRDEMIVSLLKQHQKF